MVALTRSARVLARAAIFLHTVESTVQGGATQGDHHRTCTPTVCGLRTTPVEVVFDSSFSPTCPHTPFAQPISAARTLGDRKGDCSKRCGEGGAGSKRTVAP